MSNTNSSKREGLLRCLIAALAGFIGGQIHFGERPVVEAATPVRSTRFELVDPRGHVIAFWGSSRDGSPVLSFTNRNDAAIASLGVRAGDSPFLNFLAQDLKNRLTLRLEGSENTPLLAMSDGAFEGRVLLGFIQPDVESKSSDDWGLLLRARQRDTQVVAIGMIRNNATGDSSGRIALLSEEREQMGRATIAGYWYPARIAGADCRLDTAAKADICRVWAQSGDLISDGSFRLDDSNRAAINDELRLTRVIFDGSRIYLICLADCTGKCARYLRPLKTWKVP